MENKFFPKRLVFLKNDAEKTFGELDELKKPGTVAPEFSVNAKIAEADAVWGLTEDEFLKKYNDTTRTPPLAPVLAPGLSETDLVAGKIRLIAAFDDEIEALAGEDLKAKVGSFAGRSPRVHEILSKAQSFYQAADKGVFGSDAEKQLYITNLEKFGLNLDDAEMVKKEKLAQELTPKIREQEQKEAEFQLQKLELDQLKQDAKEIDEQYGNLSKFGWKLAKIAGIGAMIGAGISTGGIGLSIPWLAAGVTSVVGISPQLAFGAMKSWNKAKQWKREGLWNLPRAETAKKHADFEVQSIQNKLSNLQAKENLKKGRIEADLKRLEERRAAIVLEMKPLTEELKIRGSATLPINKTTARLAEYQKQLKTLDVALEHQQKLVKVFSLAENHRDKLSNKVLLSTIAASEYLPGTGKQIKEVYEAPDKRTADAQKDISKIKMGDISYIIEGELSGTQIFHVVGFLNSQLKDEPNPGAISKQIDFLKSNKETLALYNLLVGMAKLPKENSFRKEALRVINESNLERTSIDDAETNLKAILVTGAEMPLIKTMFESLSSNKKTEIKTAFTALAPLAVSGSPNKDIYTLLKTTQDFEPQAPFRKAALKMIQRVLKDRSVI